MQRLKTSAHLQMFSRKYQRIAADYGAKGALFLEILGDETSETRVSQPDSYSTPPALGLILQSFGRHAGCGLSKYLSV